MREQVLGAPWVVITATKTEVAIFENVDLERVPRRNDNPDPDVKLAIKNEHGVLNVFLDHPRLLRVGLLVIPNWFHVIQIVLGVGTGGVT